MTMQTQLIDLNEWPHPAIDLRYKNKDYSWREISEKIYTYYLEVLPPKRWNYNAFMVGECLDYDYDLKDNLYVVCCEVLGRYFCRVCNFKAFNPMQFTAEIKLEFHIQ